VGPDHSGAEGGAAERAHHRPQQGERLGRATHSRDGRHHWTYEADHGRVSTEVCVAFPAISATAAGYDVYAAVDASGTFSETKRTTGILRMLQAGVIVTDYASIAVEVLNDNAAAKAAQLYAALDLPYAALVGQLSAALARPAA
jgi:hypothetical protein